MSEWNYSIVLLCQAADQVDSNIIGEALGYGPDTFSLPAGPEDQADSNTIAELPNNIQDIINNNKRVI